MNNKKIYKGEWCISSSTPDRKERIKAHKEFEASDFKKMLDDGWQLKAVRPKRPRIKKEKPVFKLFGTIECKFEIPVEILIKAGFTDYV